MAIKASSMITIMDLNDIRLSSYISCNFPTTQIYDVNNNTYSPSWSNMQITPVVFVNDTAVALTNPALSIVYRRQISNLNEADLTTGETVSNGSLKVTANKLTTTNSILTYICYISYTDPTSGVTVNTKNTMTFSLIKQGANSKTVSINGESLFKYNASGTLVGSTQIMMTANAQNVSISKWQYKNSSGSWVDYPTTTDNSSIKGSTLIVKPSHAVFVNNTATLRVITNDENCFDIHSITKIYDGVKGDTGAAGTNGTNGTSAINVIMTNEAEVLPSTSSGYVSPAKTVVTTISAYQGITQLTLTTNSVTAPTAPSGMTITKAMNADGKSVDVSMAISNNATLGSASTLSGSLVFTVSAGGVNGFKKEFSWSKSKAGNAGTNAVIFETVLSGGNVIHNGSGECVVNTVLYNGTTQVTSGISYQWAKFANGSWSNISGATAASYTVTASQVTSATTFRCTATYSNKSYTAFATIIDKTDPYSCELFSTIGTQIVNNDGVGAIYCRVWQADNEVDALKTTTISQTAPSSPSTGALWYKVDKANKTVTLMKYSGSAWAATTATADLPSLTYTWYALDKDGNRVDVSGYTWNPTNKKNKVIYIDGSMINKKITIHVEVG